MLVLKCEILAVTEKVFEQKASLRVAVIGVDGEVRTLKGKVSQKKELESSIRQGLVELKVHATAYEGKVYLSIN